MGKKKVSYTILAVSAILIAIVSWKIYSLFNQAFVDFFVWTEIPILQNFYIQGLIVILVGILIIILLGIGGKKTFERVFRIK